MLIWIPTDSKDSQTANIATLAEVKAWALVDFEEGVVKETVFYDKREDFDDWVDFIVMKNKYESYMEFLDEGMMVLCTRSEEKLSDVIEAFVFKELDEVGF